MESLISGCSSGTMLFAYKNKDKDRSFLGFRPQIGLPFNHHPPNLRISVNPISFSPQIIIHSKLLALPLSSSHTQVAVEKDEPQLSEIQITDINHTKTVHVKVQLEKECSFGQSFHIVGDDAMLGLWDPEFAVPMNWSDGHIWSIELDIPIGKAINFKFVMKQEAETVSWQPGPNRVLQIWETVKMITICEDWDNAESQKTIEVIPLSYDQLESNQEKLIDAEYFVPDPPINLENSVEMKSPEMENNGKAMDINSFSSLTSESKSMLVEDEGVPVLVPGLTLPTEQVDEGLKIEVGIPTDLNLPELDLKEEHKTNWQNVQERADVLFNDKKQLYESKKTETQQLKVQKRFITNLLDAFSNNIQWGRRILDKFLKRFGIL